MGSMKDGITDKMVHAGNSLVVQWLGLCAFTAKGLGSVSSQGTKIPQATFGATTKHQKQWYKQSIKHCARPTIGTWKCVLLLYWTCIPSSFPLKNALVFLVRWITCDWFPIQLQREKLIGLSCQYNPFPWSQQLVLRQTHEQDQVIKTPIFWTFEL